MCCTTLINFFDSKFEKKKISRIIDNNTDFPLHFLIHRYYNDLENNLKRYPLDKFNLPGSTPIKNNSRRFPRGSRQRILLRIPLEVYFNFSTIDKESISGILGNENHAPFSIMHKGSIFVSTCIRVNNDGG